MRASFGYVMPALGKARPSGATEGATPSRGRMDTYLEAIRAPTVDLFGGARSSMARDTRRARRAGYQANRGCLRAFRSSRTRR